MSLQWIDDAALRTALPYPSAVEALADAVSRPGTLAGTPPRQIVDTSAGQLLLMPAEIDTYVGVKVVTVAPGNPARGLPRISGVYVLFDSATLVPVAQFDAAELTAVRTAAVSALAVDRLAPAGASRLVVFGAGPQARAHVEAVATVRPIQTVRVVTRTPDRAGEIIGRADRLGLDAAAGSPESVAEADIVACCTTARTPLFESARLRSDATVVAVGSHEPDARELDAELVRRATVVVESRASAATAGDLVQAAGPGRELADLIAGDLEDLVAGRVAVDPARPRVFKSVGEAWQDLVVAAAAYEVVSAVNQDR